METKTKEQAGAELLAAIDGYMAAVWAEHVKEEKARHKKHLLEIIEEHKNNPFQIPDDAQGPYAQHLREVQGI